MSRRRIEQGASGASSFSLRALQTAHPTPVAATVGGARRVSAPPSVPKQAPVLNFRFSALAGAVPVAPKATEAPGGLTNFFSKTVNGPVSQSVGDTLRMTAVIDDLSTRNKKLAEVKNQLEGKVQRISSLLTQERSSAASRLQALKLEVHQAHEAEIKMRSELAIRPAAKEVDTTKFNASVRSALEQEETNARVADAESRVVSLTNRYETLSTEVKLLEERKVVGVAAQSPSADDVEALVAKATQAQARLAELEGHHAVIQDSITHLEALRTSHHDEARDAAQALDLVNKTTADSVADSVAAKEQVRALKVEHDDVAGKIATMKHKLQGMGPVATPHVTEVLGAAAPAGLLGRIDSSSAALVDSLSCCSRGVAFHFAYDCPIAVTTTPTGVGTSEMATEAMIQAIVSDLKGAFQYYADSHAKIGALTVVDLGA